LPLKLLVTVVVVVVVVVMVVADDDWGHVVVVVVVLFVLVTLLLRRLNHSDESSLTNHRPIEIYLPIGASVRHTSVFVLRPVKKSSPLQGLLNVHFVVLILFYCC